jgi:hypothetical protein
MTNKLIEEKVKEFEKKYHLVEGYELLYKSPNHFQMYDVSTGIKDFLKTSLNEVVEAVSKQKDLEISRLKHQDDELTKADCYANGYKAGVEAKRKMWDEKLRSLIVNPSPDWSNISEKSKGKNELIRKLLKYNQENNQ